MIVFSRQKRKGTHLLRPFLTLFVFALFVGQFVSNCHLIIPTKVGVYSARRV